MIQRHMEILGADGCYFLSLVYLAEKYTENFIDSARAYAECFKAGWMLQDCYILDPAAILKHLTGEKWGWSKEPADYETKPGELEILLYERNNGSKPVSHFVVGDGSGGLGWDPYGTSRTVAEGKVASKRIFRRI